jgi:hypothetical protein
MVRSFYYVAFHSLHANVAQTVRLDQVEILEPSARVWRSCVSAAFPYDLNNRPDCVRIPVRGVRNIMESPM